jgi:hypothetical protein
LKIEIYFLHFTKCSVLHRQCLLLKLLLFKTKITNFEVLKSSILKRGKSYFLIDLTFNSNMFSEVVPIEYLELSE